MKAMWIDVVIAEAPKEDLIYIEQNWYFPPSSVKQEFLQEGPKPTESSVEIVKKDFANCIAFWRDMGVTE